jgi:hypothetical protein
MSRVFVLLTGMFPRKSFFTTSTFALPGTRHMRRVRVERRVEAVKKLFRGNFNRVFAMLALINIDKWGSVKFQVGCPA